MQSSTLANWDGSLTRAEEQKRAQKRNDVEDPSKADFGQTAQIYSINDASISEVYSGHNNFSPNGFVDLEGNMNGPMGLDASIRLERADHVKNLEEMSWASHGAGTSAVGPLAFSNRPTSMHEVLPVLEGYNHYTGNGHEALMGPTETYTSIHAGDTPHIKDSIKRTLSFDQHRTTHIDPLVFSNSFRSTPNALPPEKIMFIPIATSPLHAHLSRNELSSTRSFATPSRATKQPDVNFLLSLDVREPTPIPEAPIFPPRAPKQINDDVLPSLGVIETMSEYSMDAEGEEEEDLFVVQNMLTCHPLHKTPTRSKRVPTASPVPKSPLFTPPPSIVPSVNELFTPPSSPPPPKRRRRFVMSHVSIPPFPDGKSKGSYMSLPRPRKKKKVSGQVHQSLQEALSSSINHNASTGTLPFHKKVNFEKPRSRPRPLPPSPQIETPKKRARPKDDYKGKDAKRRRITIDLTLFDDDDSLDKSGQRPPLDRKQQMTHSRYHKNEARTELFIYDFEPLSTTTIAFNTRFIRKELGEDDQQNPDIVQLCQRGIMPHKTNTHYSSVLCPLIRGPLKEHTTGAYSVGGTVSELSEEGDHLLEPLQMEQESDSIIFVDSTLPTPRLPNIVAPKPSRPPRVDLIEMRKKVRDPQRVTGRSDRKPKQSPPKGHHAHITTSPTRKKAKDSPQKLDDYAPAAPSAKALGKRKATTPSPPPSPTVFQDNVQSTSVSSSYPHHSLPHSTFLRPSAVINGYSHETTLMALYQDSTHNDEFGGSDLTDPMSLMSPHPHPRHPLPQGTNEDALADLDYSVPNSAAGYEDSWSGSLVMDDIPQYKSEYIDPTLLGGQPQDYLGPEDESFSENGGYHAAEDAGSTSSSSSSSERSKEHGHSIFSGPDSDSDDSDVILVNPAIRKRLSPTPVSDELNVVGVPAKRSKVQSTSEYESPSALSESEGSRPLVSRKRTIRKPARYRQPSSESSDSDSDWEGPSKPQERKKPSMTPFDPESYRPKPKSAPLKASRVAQVWPIVESEEYCHQCRHKSFIQKMSCSTCTKKFCARCLSIRYPDKTFNLSSCKLCPFCECYCNCTSCCTKRGETYISSARPSKTISERPPSRPVRQPKVPLPSVPPPTMPPATVAAPATTRFWGTLYSLTGERMGRAYVDPNAADSMIYAQSVTAKAAPSPQPLPLPPSPPVQRAKPKRKRFFIGKIQRSWGMKIKKTKPERYIKHAIIGKSRFLRYEKTSIPAANPNCDDWGDLSSLSSLESDVEPEATQFSLESLEDNDISRAIALSLAACAVEGTHDDDVAPPPPQPDTIAGPLPS